MNTYILLIIYYKQGRHYSYLQGLEPIKDMGKTIGIATPMTVLGDMGQGAVGAHEMRT